MTPVQEDPEGREARPEAGRAPDKVRGHREAGLPEVWHPGVRRTGVQEPEAREAAVPEVQEEAAPEVQAAEVPEAAAPEAQGAGEAATGAAVPEREPEVQAPEEAATATGADEEAADADETPGTEAVPGLRRWQSAALY